MSSDRQSDDLELDRLLDELLDLTPDDRQSKLANLSGERPALARRLGRLLDLALEDSDALAPAGALKGSLLNDLFVEDAPPLVVGETFCGYLIEALVGTGGMSNVYRARRDYGEFTTTVALKLIRQSPDRPIRPDTLRHEQRALARLEHPGIARFIDAGEGPNGELNLAMEYVDGEPILAHADRLQLGIRQRVRLLIALCRALEHAHARRLVHGDVKSANVLVDTDQRLRLVDFGIASDTSNDADDATKAFTPECAAPEQLMAKGITTATDVYQVGALAYRLLSGYSRLTDDDPGRSPMALPPPPSLMIERIPVADALATAKLRGLADHSRLKGALRGDLDAIILRCLCVDPEQRYASMSDLREDLEDWSALRCIRARPRTAGLRIGKFLRRNARASITVASILLLTSIASALALIRLRAAELERLAEADRAIQVERYMSEMFRAASPYLRAETSDPLATVAAVGAGLLEGNSELDYRTSARLGLSLAELQLARGNSQEAEQLLSRVDGALRSGSTGLSALHAEYLSAQAIAEAAADRTEAAVALQQQAVEELLEIQAAPLTIALAQGQLGDLLRRLGRLDEAESAFAQSIPVLLDTAHGGLAIDRVRNVDRYVRFLTQRGRLQDMRLLRGELSAFSANVASNGVVQAELSSVLAEIDSALTGPELAAQGFEASAGQFEALLGEQHPRVPRALLDACVSRLESGQLERARELCSRGFELYEHIGEAESFNAAIALNNLATIAYDSGSLIDADAHAKRSSELFERHEQPYARLHGQLLQARIAAAHGRNLQALSHLQIADAIRRELDLDNSELVLELAQQRTFAMIGEGRLDEAQRVLVSAEPVLEAILPANRARNQAWTEVARAQLAGAQVQPAQVQSAMAAALSEYAQTPGRNDLEQGWMYYELAAAALSAGLKAKALALSASALQLLHAEAHGMHWANAWAVHRLAGGPADEQQDARAGQTLVAEQVATQLADRFLDLR